MFKSAEKGESSMVHLFITFCTLLTLGTNSLWAQCYQTANQALSTTYNYGTGNGSNSLVNELALTNLLGGTFDFDATLSGNTTWQNGIELIDDPTFGDVIYMQPANTGNSTSFATYTLNFHEPIENFSFVSAGLNYNDQFTISASLNGIPITINSDNFSDFNPSTGWTITENSVENPQAVGSTEINANLFTTTIPGPLDQITIVATKANTSNSTVTTAIHTMSYCNFLLPIELMHFDGICIDRDAEIHWMTASESGNDYFMVEHATDGIEFSSIGEVRGAGYSSEVRSYQFIHSNMPLGDNFYRLKQFDFDGSYTSSAIIRITRNQLTADDLRLSPNPVSSFLLVESGQSIPQEIQVLDMGGNLLRTEIVRNQQAEIDLSDLKSGIYLVKCGAEIHRVMKQ